jgi:hypothetical protein
MANIKYNFVIVKVLIGKSGNSSVLEIAVDYCG